jgi:hypothetical protein
MTMQQAGQVQDGAESGLQMFTADNEEWVIARSVDDARDVYCSVMGFDPNNDPNPDKADMFGTHVQHWKPIRNLDKEMTLTTECNKTDHQEGKACSQDGCDGKGTIKRKLTVAQWIREHGRGYWGGANY